MDRHQQSIKDAKSAKEMQDIAEEPTVVKPPDEEDEQGGHVVENEEETKESKPGKPEWKKYYHLVVVAKNRVGLGNLFTLVKKSFKHGFYRFPRIDFKMLKEHGEGLVVSTACVGGLASGLIYSEFPDRKFSELSPSLFTGDAAEAAVRSIRGRLDNMVDSFVDAVGRDNFFLELQFNDLPAQHLTNRCLIDASIRNGIPLVATADSHFPSPDKWQARELYKKLGWMGAKLDKTMLPKLEDMKTMLYPKNATQMWDEFKKGYEQHDFYHGHEELVRDAIERTHDIAWQKCEDTWIDVSGKLPKFGTPEKSAFSMLSDLVKEGLVREGLADKHEYVARAKEELSDIKYLGHEAYFLAMQKIFHRAETQTLLGPGRGSGAGSLVNFLLGITQIDPIPYGLLWSRFLGRHRCLQKDTLVLSESGTKPISQLNVGEKVLTSGGTYECVIDKEDDVKHDINALIKTTKDSFSCSPNHRWLVRRDGEVQEVLTTDLRKGDKLLFIKQKSPCEFEEVEIDEVVFSDRLEEYVDIEVENDHTFFVSTAGDNFALTHNTSWPDIDTDAGDRDVLIDAARDLFGDDAVIPVSNFNTLKLKSLIKDIAKFYDVPFDEVNAMTGPLQDEVMAFAKDENQEKSVFVLKHEDCMKYSEGYRNFMEKYPDVAAHVETLFMENRSIGRHAGGVIIAPAEDLERTMPIISVRGELQTPWTEGMNFRNLEDNGFLKFDFLGLTLLKDVENCIARILKRQGNPRPTFADVKAFFDKHLNCRYVLQDDPKVWEHVYHNARFTGVFQFTASGARKFCLDAKPSSIEELAALTAIYRPGPLKANVHRKYVEAKNNASLIKYEHPVIEKVLGPSYNFVVFQEQFMTLAVELAGFSPGESDQLRKTLVKKSLDTMGKKGDEREEACLKFIKGAKELHGVPENITSALWSTIEAFSVYGFNKSHAVAYAIDSYYAAWLHTHFETDWLATILQSENGNPDGLKKAITEIKAYGYRFQEADINYSGDVWNYSEELEAFVPPLSSIKGVGDTAMQEIMHNRPYKSLDDLLYDPDGEWRHSKVNKTALRALCMIEALGSLQELKDGTIRNHRQLLAILSDDKNYETLRKGKWGMTKSQVKKALKDGGDLTTITTHLIEQYQSLPDWTRTEKIMNHVEMTSDAPQDLVFPSGFVRRVTEKDVPSVFTIPGGGKGVGWFCASETIQKTTKKGKAFLRIRAIDSDNNSGWIRVWGKFEQLPEPYTLWIGEVDNDANWGMATTSWKLKQIKAFE